MRSRLIGALGVAALATPVGAVAQRVAPSAIPTPASVIDFEPGADRKLPEWQPPTVLAQRLVAAEDDEAQSIRRNALVILVPSLNPDGVDIVGDWYRRSIGTTFPLIWNALRSR